MWEDEFRMTFFFDFDFWDTQSIIEIGTVDLKMTWDALGPCRYIPEK